MSENNNSDNGFFKNIFFTTVTVCVFIFLISIFSFVIMNFDMNSNKYYFVILLILSLSSFIGGFFISKSKSGVKVIINSLILFGIFFLICLVINYKSLNWILTISVLPTILISGFLSAIIKNNKKRGKYFDC